MKPYEFLSDPQGKLLAAITKAPIKNEAIPALNKSRTPFSIMVNYLHMDATHVELNYNDSKDRATTVLLKFDNALSLGVSPLSSSLNINHPITITYYDNTWDIRSDLTDLCTFNDNKSSNSNERLFLYDPNKVLLNALPRQLVPSGYVDCPGAWARSIRMTDEDIQLEVFYRGAFTTTELVFHEIPNSGLQPINAPFFSLRPSPMTLYFF